MTRPITRIQPALPAAAMKTYAIASPPATHTRPASCEEVDCRNWRRGWKTVVDENTDLGARQAHYIRKQSGRRYTAEHDEAGLTVFTFEAGQPCFTQHRKSLERPELFMVRSGDWRGNPRGDQPVQHKRPEDWVEDFATHQDQLADRLKRG
jgi:hypothetical protein